MPPPGERAEQADDDDRGEAGPGRQPLAVAEPEDQQRHDHGAAADPEEAAEDARQGADRRQLAAIACEGIDPERGRHAAILDAVPRERRRGKALGHAARSRCEPTPPGRRSSPTSTGPWRRSPRGPRKPRCPAAARAALARLSERYGLVGCVSGRRAEEARRLVGLDGIAYAGNHGLELLLPGDESPRPTPRWPGARARPPTSSPGSTASDCRRQGCGSRTRDRSRPCTGAAPATRRHAEGCAHEVAVEAGRAGLEPRWGRKVLELRPVGGGGKDAAVASLLPAGASARPSTPATTAPTSTPFAVCASCASRASWRRRSASASSRRRRRRSCPRSPT